MSIPKVIHYCWFGGNEKPALIQKCIRSWRKYCPDYEIIEWNETNFDIHCIPFCRHTYQLKKWAFVTDYVRLAVLRQYGGIYMDTDVELVKNLDPFLEYPCFMGFQHANFISNGLVMGAEPQNWLVDENAKIYEQMDGDTIASDRYAVCQEYTTELLKSYGASIPCTGTVQIIKDVHIFPPEYFCPYNNRTCEMHRTKNTYAIHHFASSWWDEEDRKKHRKMRRKLKLDYWLHAPNRIMLSALGEDRYRQFKSFFSR